jgi:alcohol dehydrogenase class IV
MRFEFATATRIIFGRGSADSLGDLCRARGSRALIVTGRQPERWRTLLEKLAAGGLTNDTFSISGEPKIGDVEAGAAAAGGADLILAIGGGSVIDAGKAIAAMAAQPGPLLDYLEIVGKGQPIPNPPLPFIAVPTTAGTGAEVTRNAVIASPEHGVKASLRHASMLPAAALIDPELARACPAAVTAASGMDALTQCLEAYVSCRSQPLTDALCVDGIRRAAHYLERAVADGSDLEARENLALAALYSGMALANAGLGAVHGFAAPIGGRFAAPHGAVCAALLAPVWAANLRAAEEAGNESLLRKFGEAAFHLTGDAAASPEAGVRFLRDLTRRLAIPGLTCYGLTKSDSEPIADQAARSSSMKGNPVVLDHESLRAIFLAAL